MLKEEIRDMIRSDFSNYNKTVKQVINDYGIGKTLAYQLQSEAEIMTKRTVVTSEQYSIKGDIVGVIGDSHLPFEREHYFDFCYETFRRKGVTRVVHIGDLVDNHAFSRHATEMDADGGTLEFKKAYSKIKELKKMFADYPFTWIKGNHDRIPVRQAASANLPSVFLKSLGQLYDVPKWEIDLNTVIDGVYYTHGLGCMSTLLTAQRIRRSAVFGHSHSKAEIMSHASFDDLVYGFHVGSGCDDKAIAFAYAKDTVLKSVISCGTIEYGVSPSLHYMPL